MLRRLEMIRKIITGCLVATCFFIIASADAESARSQGLISTPTAQLVSPTSDPNEQNNTVDKDLFEIRIRQEQEIETLKEINEQNKFLLTALAGVLTVIVAAGGIFGIFQASVIRTQLRIESERES